MWGGPSDYVLDSRELTQQSLREAAATHLVLLLCVALSAPSPSSLLFSWSSSPSLLLPFPFPHTPPHPPSSLPLLYMHYKNSKLWLIHGIILMENAEYKKHSALRT